MIYVVIAAGGALGALSRYFVAGWVQDRFFGAYPWGTFVVNVVGAFLLGFSYRLFEGLAISPETRAFAAVGFLGAFTTFSTFSYETATLMQDGEWSAAALYSLGSLALGVAAVFAGFWLAAATLQARGT